MAHKVNKYPDGTSYINEVGLECNPFKINSYEDLWHLNQYVDAFISKFGIEPNIYIPNLIDAQADRRFNEGESSGLRLVLRFLNSLPVKKYHIFHPHNPEVVEAILNRVEIIDNSEFIEKVLKNLITTFSSVPHGDMYTKIDFRHDDNLILMSSDAGGFKPLSKLCDKIGWKGEMYSAAKARSWSEDDGTKFVQQVDRQDFQGKDILIIDDLSIGGGTFKGLSKLLKERNCGKLYLAVSHMTIQNLGKDPVTNYFDKVFTTNSKFDSYMDTSKGIDRMFQPNNLEIIKLF